MAGYLAAQFPGDYYNSDESKAVDFFGYFNHKKQQEEAFKNQQINREMALEDLDFTRKENPLKLETRRLSNVGQDLGNIFQNTKNENAQRDLQVRKGVPIEDEITAAKSKLAREITDDELKTSEAAIKRFMSDPANLTDPKNRAIAQQMYDSLYEIRKMREGFANKEEIENIKADARRRAAEEVTARYAAAQKDKEVTGWKRIESALEKIKDPNQKLAQIRVYLSIPEYEQYGFTLAKMERDLIAQITQDNNNKNKRYPQYDPKVGGMAPPTATPLAPVGGASSPSPSKPRFLGFE